MDNRRLFLPELLSIDAWHEPIKLSERSASVFVDLTLHDGRIGGDRPEIPFTFTASLKRALVTVHVEKPLKIDRLSIASSVPEGQVEFSRLRGARDLAESKVGVEGGLDRGNIFLKAVGETSHSNERSNEDNVKLLQTVPPILVTPKTEGGRGYSWILEPTFHEVLKGQPWHPHEEPRLKVGSTEPDFEDGLVRVEVKCAFEDIEIGEPVPKPEEFIRRGEDEKIIFPETNRASAIQFLRLMLTEAHLMPERLDNRFREVIIASVIAIED